MEIERLAFTVTECAKMLGLSKNTTYKLMVQNKIPHIRLNGRVIVPKEALMDWLDSSSHLTRAPDDAKGGKGDAAA